ncbi:type 11 methyltransferase [Nitzschia inconspicua]|uniref:Type 11 methyltransferase n=1 Tax=Nitzschia inconspicua TaxID=303405 RepID=A0A9K3KWG2_9STRA|nr:type 11 methyltransferase [Nitzschia inconspicua]
MIKRLPLEERRGVIPVSAIVLFITAFTIANSNALLTKPSNVPTSMLSKIISGNRSFLRMMTKVSSPCLWSVPVKTDSQWDVDLYQQQHSYVWKYGSSLIDVLEKELETSIVSCQQHPSNRLRILDVGCGSGELTKELFLRVNSKFNDATKDKNSCHLQVAGIDFDETMVHRAQKENSMSPKLVFFQSDVCQLSPIATFPATETNTAAETLGQFDAIVSNACLHWVHDADAGVAAMSSVLKPNGKFVVEFGGAGNVGAIVQATAQVIQKRQPGNDHGSVPFRPWYFPSIGEYTTILEKHGIEATSAVLYDRPTPLDDGKNGMKNWLNMFGGPLLDNFIESTSASVSREDVIAEIVDLLRPTLYSDSEAQWVADYRRIRVVGQKK